MITKYTRFAAAAVIYALFAGYLYRPYFKGFGSPRLQDLFVVNVCLASLGAYVLSRRWMAGFAESFFAGAVYGFGPFILGLVRYHPTAGFLAAAVPWLFCPAAFGPKGKYKPIRVPLSFLPFLAIVLFFQLAGRFGLYPIPINLKLNLSDLSTLLVPLVAAKRNKILFGFYHVPVAALIVGLCMLSAPLESLINAGILHKGKFFRDLIIRRFGIVAIFVIATILAFYDSFLGISPIIWLTISTLCCSVIIGAGMQGLTSAGHADRKPILLTAILLGVFSIVTLLFAARCFQVAIGLGAGFGRLLTDTAKMYILAAVTVAMIFIIARSKLRLHAVRQILLCATMALDIFLGARFIIDTIL